MRASITICCIVGRWCAHLPQPTKNQLFQACSSPVNTGSKLVPGTYSCLQACCAAEAADADTMTSVLSSSNIVSMALRDNPCRGLPSNVSSVAKKSTTSPPSRQPCARIARRTPFPLLTVILSVRLALCAGLHIYEGVAMIKACSGKQLSTFCRNLVCLGTGYMLSCGANCERYTHIVHRIFVQYTGATANRNMRSTAQANGYTIRNGGVYWVNWTERVGVPRHVLGRAHCIAIYACRQVGCELGGPGACSNPE